MTYELVCSKCGSTLYSGIELRSPTEILRPFGYKCKKCGAKLNLESFKMEVLKIQ